MKLILPTAKIIKDYRSYEELFSFYELGLKGIVRDIIIHNARWKEIERKKYAESITDQILLAYSFSPESNLERLSSNGYRVSKVEIMIKNIEDSINQMLFTLLANHCVIFKREHDWLHNDLIIETVLKERIGDAVINKRIRRTNPQIYHRGIESSFTYF